MATPTDDDHSFANFDHHSEDHLRDVQCIWARMRAEPGLPRSEVHGGFYVVSRYDDVSEVAKNYELFSSAQGIAIPELDFDDPLLPIETDPPIHREYRRLLSPFLTFECVAKQEGMMRSVANDLLEGFVGKRHVDFVAAFAKLFPSRVALNFLGFPPEDATELDRLLNGSIGERGSEQASHTAKSLEAYIDKFLDQRRRVALLPNDLVSAVAHAAIANKPLTPAEQNSVVKLLLFGGFTTTMFALSFATKWLAEHPEERRRLRAEPALLGSATNEFVRYSSPGCYIRRTVTTDTTLCGTPLHSGDRVLLSYGSANHDPDVFDGPEKVVLDRTPNRHVAFGQGNHTCVGVHLARLQIQVALERILARLIEFEVDVDAPIRYMSGETQGISFLPLAIHEFV